MDLFNKYGGAEFWSGFLNVFYSRIVSSDVLSHHFTGKDIEHIKSMLIGLLEVTLVSEGNYQEESLKVVHCHMGITVAELDEWLVIYELTLTELGVEDEDTQYLLQLIDKYKPCIISENEPSRD